jgi:hypothetical protein
MLLRDASSNNKVIGSPADGASRADSVGVRRKAPSLYPIANAWHLSSWKSESVSESSWDLATNDDLHPQREKNNLKK